MIVSLGLYPDNPCFDPRRPDWLPYWDITPDEAGCVLGFYPGVTTMATPPPPSTPPGPVVPALDASYAAGASPKDLNAIPYNTWQAEVEQTKKFFDDIQAGEDQRQAQNATKANLWIIGGLVIGTLILGQVVSK